MTETEEKVIEARKWILEHGKGRKQKAISENDCLNLLSILSGHPPLKIMEIGTWYGTSAMVAVHAGHEVWTCDKHNEFIYSHDNIHYYNMLSNDFLNKMKKKKIIFDAAFIDGRLPNSDVKLFVKLMKPGSIIIAHDCFGKEKGVRNFIKLSRYISEVREVCGMGVALIRMSK